MPYLIANYMDPVTAGVTLIGPLAATMSTVSSLLLGGRLRHHEGPRALSTAQRRAATRPGFA